MSFGTVLSLLLAWLLLGCAGPPNTESISRHMYKQKTTNQDPKQQEEAETNGPAGAQVATFGQGCFWCAEAIFESLKGVISVTSGYSGGQVPNPTYEQVCTGQTGHAEVVQIVFDPKVITYEELLEVFWLTHDPTTPNRQGNDIGPQYRSIILYHNEDQKRLAEKAKAELEKVGAWDQPIVTEIVAFEVFYPAEEYHQNYFARNPDKAYCQAVIRPKMEKFRKVFKSKLKDGQ